MELPLTFIPYSTFTAENKGRIMDNSGVMIAQHITKEHAMCFIDLVHDKSFDPIDVSDLYDESAD